MKKIMLAAALAAAVTAFGDLKIGTVDMFILVRNHASYESNKELLKSTEADYRRQLDGIRDEIDRIQEDGKKIAEELKNPLVSQSAKEKAERELAGVQKRFIQAQQRLRDETMRNQQQLSDLESKLLKGQASDLKKKITTFASKNGYDLILDSAAAIFHSKDLDVTDAVLKEMGVDPKAAREKMKNEGKWACLGPRRFA